jgi:hypothetical protein
VSVNHVLISIPRRFSLGKLTLALKALKNAARIDVHDPTYLRQCNAFNESIGKAKASGWDGLHEAVQKVLEEGAQSL